MMEINVSIDNVDLLSEIGTTHSQDAYGEYQPHPLTLAEAVVERIFKDLRRDDGYHNLRKRVNDLRDEQIREHIKPIIAEAIATPVQKTNAFGDPIGEPTTLRELVMAETKKMLAQQSRSGAYDQKTSLVQQVVHEEVEKALQKELRQAVAAEKEKVVAAVRAKAADLIATAVKEGVGR